MIIDRLDKRHLYAHIPGLADVLEEIARLDATAEAGTHLKIEAIGHVSVAEFTSLDPQQQTRFEAHRKYADIHVVLAGKERIDIASLEALQPVTDFDTESDIGFHEGSATATVVLEPGWFVVCFPHDAHRPGISVDGPSPVRKAVGKLLV